MIQTVGEFLNSTAWSVLQVVVNWALCYAFWRLGQTRGRIQASGVITLQHELIKAQHQALQTAQTHLDNYEARLNEARQ